jgi:hypothetical protein
MANRIPPDQTLVVQGVPEDKRGLVQDAIQIQSMSESVVLQSQRSSLMGPVTFVPDRTPGTEPRFLCFANYRDAMACLVGIDGLERWLLMQEWGLQVSLYIKKNGPTAPKVMVPADQTLVIKGVPEDKKALITQALQTYTTGQLGIPNYVKDNTNVFVLYGGPVQYICYANYADAQKCVEAVVGMENWLRGQGDWARMLLVYVKILNGPTVPSA